MSSVLDKRNQARSLDGRHSTVGGGLCGVVNSPKLPAWRITFSSVIPFVCPVAGPETFEMLKVDGNAASLAPDIRRIGPNSTASCRFDVKSMGAIISSITARERLTTILFGLFGRAGTVLLEAIGIYGVTKYR